MNETDLDLDALQAEIDTDFELTTIQVGAADPEAALEGLDRSTDSVILDILSTPSSVEAETLPKSVPVIIREQAVSLINSNPETIIPSDAQSLVLFTRDQRKQLTNALEETFPDVQIQSSEASTADVAIILNTGLDNTTLLTYMNNALQAVGADRAVWLLSAPQVLPNVENRFVLEPVALPAETAVSSILKAYRVKATTSPSAVT